MKHTLSSLQLGLGILSREDLRDYRSDKRPLDLVYKPDETQSLLSHTSNLLLNDIILK